MVNGGKFQVLMGLQLPWSGVAVFGFQAQQK
jgi:hypothetical protein